MANSRPNPDGSTTPKIIIDAWVPLGYQQITGAPMTAGTGLTVPAGATMALISVSGATMRWRDDGTAPTASVVLGTVLALAQDQTPNIPPVYIQGAPAIGNCLKWVNGNTVTDSGVSCQGSPQPPTVPGTGTVKTL